MVVEVARGSRVAVLGILQLIAARNGAAVGRLRAIAMPIRCGVALMLLAAVVGAGLLQLLLPSLPRVLPRPQAPQLRVQQVQQIWLLQLWLPAQA